MTSAKKNAVLTESGEPAEPFGIAVSEESEGAGFLEQVAERLYENGEKREASRRGYLFFKRTFDIVSSFLLLVVLSPLIALCLLVKWLEDFHNPIYVSERVGRGGKIFRFYKIRSMRPMADTMKDDMIKSGMNEADGPVFKIKNDPRITPFGRILRRTSADELLQLINVFKGDMSVVGPRPPLPDEVESYTEEQTLRLSVRGGLLCLWQIQPDRHSVPFDEWIRYDLEYIEKRSVVLDMKIILKGAAMILTGKSGD